jgi:hypothetical protein
VEVFVSPWSFLDMPAKIFLGCLAAAAFWLWTWWPLPQARSESRNRA